MWKPHQTVKGNNVKNKTIIGLKSAKGVVEGTCFALKIRL